MLTGSRWPIQYFLKTSCRVEPCTDTRKALGAASLIVSACVRQALLEGQGLSLGIHTQGLLQLGFLRNLKPIELCNLHTKWSGLIQNKPLNFKCGGGGKKEAQIIASFSELIGWESMEENQETADKRWQQCFLEGGTHWHNDSKTHF